MLRDPINTETDEKSQVGIKDDTFDISTAAGNLTKIFKEPANTLISLLDKIKEQFSFEKYINATKSLNEESYRLARSLGVSSQRTRELTVAVADAIPEFVGIGLEVKDAGLTMSSLYESLNTNLSLSKETLVDFAATAKVTGVEQKTLATNFRDVGVSLSMVGENMLQVTKIAQQAGVTVKAVSDAVVSNLDKMNIYNFDGGIKGLAKMAAQASRLGISMEGVFGFVDKVFNPEGAINMAAALQRLGVTTSDLLDPLRLMDLSQNDPTELQNQIVSMTKEFVRFDTINRRFEILPGAKRRLNEIGAQMGYNNGELQKMAINAANFDFKLKQIRMPSLAINEETKNLIATMAQINERGIAEVRVAQVDSSGNFTGEYENVAVQKLTETQIKILERQQLSTEDTMSDIAKDQLDELRKVNTNMSKFIMAQRYGIASSNLFSGAYVNTLSSLNKTIKNSKIGQQPAQTSKTYRENMADFEDKSLTEIADLGADELIKLVTSAANKGANINLAQIGTKIVTSIGNVVNTNLGNITEKYLEKFSEIKPTVVHSGVVDMNFTHTFDFNDLSNLSPQMKELIKDLFIQGLTETEIRNLIRVSIDKIKTENPNIIGGGGMST